MSASDEHLWLRSPTAGVYTHYVAAVSNRRWPLASAKPQVAVCGFFKTLEEATEFAAAHQKYRNPERTMPLGPIFLVLECGRLFPLALSPIRLFGAESADAAKKRDALLRNYYRKRELEKAEVAERKGKEDTGPAHTPGTDASRDSRLKRTAERRARRHAWELLQRLHSQKDRLRRAAVYLGSGGHASSGDNILDDELADFLEGLTESQRASIARSSASGAEVSGAAAAGAAAGAGEEASAEPAETVVPKNEINPTPNTKMGTLDDYIAWATRHFESQGIRPASDEMMDAEERQTETLELSSTPTKSTPAHAPTAAAANPSPSAHLPSAPDGQTFCLGAIFFDDTGARLNKECPEATGMEHVVTFFEPAANADAAKEILQKALAPAFKEERLFFVRTGVWCCFDHITDDDGLHLYREEMVGEMLNAGAENHMLKFVEKALEQRPDMLPIPTSA
jgi:hypothetical protein